VVVLRGEAADAAGVVCTGAAAGVIAGLAAFAGGADGGVGEADGDAAAGIDVVVLAVLFAGAAVGEPGEGLKLSNVEFAVWAESESDVTAGNAVFCVVVDLRPML
jgi:hypothetical protein